MALTPEQIARYSRQLVIPAIGPAGQERLAAARVRVIGATGAVAPGLLYLALAGAGTLWIDDAEPVTGSDLGHWLYPPGALGAPRGRTAAEALQARSRFVRVLAEEPEGGATAALIFAPTPARAVVEAERARKGALPHVVAELDGEGGTVVSVPAGAPCFSCARSIDGTRRPPAPGTAAVAALAAEELILLLANPAAARGRRVDVTRGVPAMRSTARLAGCACAADIAR